MINPGLSDLFFNYEHPEYDRLNDPEGNLSASDEDLHRAILTDATQFVSTLELAFPGAHINTPAELADDFMARL